MKIYISADIEGVAGLTNWDETEKGHPDYQTLSPLMTGEVKAACEGALNAGATEIWIKDAHDSGRNIDITQLPDCVHLIRGWSGSPLKMMQELNESFNAVLMIGYHSNAGSRGNPLAHTMNTRNNYVKINDILASEFLINTYTASMFGVPVVFVSGDEDLGRYVRNCSQYIQTVGTKSGIGNSVISRHPARVRQEIKQRVEKALQGKLEDCFIKLPEKFIVEISYIAKLHYNAYRASFYPGVKQLSSNEILFESSDYYEVLRMLLFTL